MLVHGDAHRKNFAVDTLLAAPGAELGPLRAMMIDFQFTGRGPARLDIAYFLVGRDGNGKGFITMPLEHESTLLQRYHEALVAGLRFRNIAPPTLDAVRNATILATLPTWAQCSPAKGKPLWAPRSPLGTTGPCSSAGHASCSTCWTAAGTSGARPRTRWPSHACSLIYDDFASAQYYFVRLSLRDAQHHSTIFLLCITHSLITLVVSAPAPDRFAC